METIRLNNGVEMPILGYGVYQVTPEAVSYTHLTLPTIA